MTKAGEPLVILVVDDDPDDRLMVKEALEEADFDCETRFVFDGVELFDYLQHRNKYSAKNAAPQPDLILLDLNMPRKDGREALQELKSDPELKKIPVVVLTTSREDRDIQSCYDLGANSFIVKPVSFKGLVETMESLSSYWANIVKLPSKRG